jgi:hypothetical protein
VSKSYFTQPLFQSKRKIFIYGPLGLPLEFFLTQAQTNSGL